MSSDREQLKEIIGGVQFKLGQRAQENKFLSFYDLYGQKKWQSLFVSLPGGIMKRWGAITFALFGQGKDMYSKLGQSDAAKVLGVSGDFAADFTKLMNKMHEEAEVGFDKVFPETGAHLGEQAGDEASRVDEGDWSVLLEKLASDIEYNVSIFNGIKNASDLQEMLIQINDQLGADQREAIQDFIAKYSPETTGDGAVLEDKIRNELIPEKAAETFDGWKADLEQAFPDAAAFIEDMFDRAKKAVQ